MADTSEAAVPAGGQHPDPFPYEWLSGLIGAMDERLGAESKAAVVKECAAVHYRSAKMDEIVRSYVGNLDAFLRMLTDTWQWKVSFDSASGIVTADENKDHCVCPLVRNAGIKMSPTLCNCSEGFAERMFSAVVGRPVHATVTRSILRGDSSCTYAIRI